MKLYDEEFLNNLPSDPKIALYEICLKYINSTQEQQDVLYLETFALMEMFIKEYGLNIVIINLTPSHNRLQRKNMITNFIDSQKNNLELYAHANEEERELQQLRNEFLIHIGNPFIYEFSDGDLKRIQELINQLRDLISQSQDFEEKHKRRLLNRLEKLQSETHKKQSDLDHFWGLVGDAGVVFGKFGENAKPLVDRIKEITSIVWRTQSRAEELPSDSKPALLSNDD